MAEGAARGNRVGGARKAGGGGCREFGEGD